MKRLVNPDDRQVSSLFLRRQDTDQELVSRVRRIVEQVRTGKDAALRSYTEEFDHVVVDTLLVESQEIAKSESLIDSDLKQAIKHAFTNILAFHRAQLSIEPDLEIERGLVCWRKKIPIRRVGLYIPGGSAPLFSTVLMLAVPAMVAGCEDIVLCTPPNKDGVIHPAILYCASLANISTIVKAGGAQAIAAMAYGTESISRVDKIFGPGNRYVTAAKQLVQSDSCAIDMPAGPSEVMILADCTSNAAFVAADMLSQSEHGPDSQAVLIVRDNDILQAQAFIDQVEKELVRQIRVLNRTACLQSSLDRSFSIIVGDTQRMVELSDEYAPEHLIIQTEDADDVGRLIRNAGSVFIGPWSPEAAGDYATGPNHTLPTSGWAVSYSGVSIESFMKHITFQKLDHDALQAIAPTVTTMARAESLDAHAQAVSIRLAEHTTEGLL
ncbi:MAG: histidinol dehydrogenase [Sphaerochaetaceae bacterium]|nr:histidinol dehydrogenase [Sphaerochaetaceae bacterium]